MKKPHEQEWTSDRHMVVNEDGKGICRMQGSGATTEAEALILAAPDMARALMAFYRSGHACREDETQCLHCTAAAALRKAGVLP